MYKIIKTDIVIAVILIGTWLFYLIFEGSTRFDINQTYTLPLLVAIEFTALATLFAAGRYYTAKKGKIGLIDLMKEHQTGQEQDKAESENNKS